MLKERPARAFTGLPMILVGIFLLVVLCSERAANLVVNAGTLYH